MTEQGCSPTGAEPVAVSKVDFQEVADRYEDFAVPGGQIGPTEIHLGYSFVDVLQVAASYLVQLGLEDDWASSGLTVRSYLRDRFGVVSARVEARQARREARWLRGLLAETLAARPELHGITSS